MNGGFRPGRDNPEAELALQELRSLVRPAVERWQRKQRLKALIREWLPAAVLLLIVAALASVSAGPLRGLGAVVVGVALSGCVVGGIHLWSRR